MSNESKPYDSTDDTRRHIELVSEYVNLIIKDLTIRAFTHDESKFYDPEKSIFDECTPKLKELTYGSDEYKEQLKVMKQATDHHYKVNSHHPEHYENGIKGMTVVDLVEMICDWKAAAIRNKNVDILKSIDKSQERFGFSDELKSIIINTVKMLEENE
jgi:hypothetical protein